MPFKSQCLLGFAPLISIVIKFLASRWLTVYVMLVSALVMAAITVAEAVEDTGRTPYRLYLSWWFTGLLWIVWINLACNAIERSWWTVKRLPGSLMHVGFLLILTGGFFTWQIGIRGDLPISEKSTMSAFRVDAPVLHLDFETAKGAETRDFVLTKDGIFQSRGFLDSLNPFGSRSLHSAEIAQTVTIVDHMPSSRIEESVVEAPAGTGRPAISLEVASDRPRAITLREGDSITLDEDDLSMIKFAATGRGDDGPSNAGDLVRAAFGHWIEIRPPEGASIFVGIELPGDVGVEKTEGDYTIKVVEYHPNFKVGRAPAPDDPPLNPAVKLDVSGPGGEKTLYAFSLVEFHGNRFDDGTEVKFHQPTDKPTLLLLTDGTGDLQAWRNADEEPAILDARNPLTIGAGGLRVSLSAFFAGSRFEKRFVPDESRQGPPAFKVQIGEEGAPTWISADEGRALSPDGLLRASIGATLPLGFELTLDDAVAEYWPASGIPKAYYSFVKIKDQTSGAARPTRIETNAPLLQNSFRLYQSGMDQQPPFRYSVFAVAFDPGLPFVTIGFLVMVAGLLWLYTNRFVRKPLGKRRQSSGVTP